MKNILLLLALAFFSHTTSPAFASENNWCSKCWGVWQGNIKTARNLANLASENANGMAGGGTVEVWNSKIQGYYKRIRECCTEDEMGERCGEISEPEPRRMCLGLPVPRPSSPSSSPVPDDPPERINPSPDSDPPKNTPPIKVPEPDRDKPQEEDDGIYQPAYPPGGMPQSDEDYGPGRFPIPQATPTNETIRNLMAVLLEIGLPRMSRNVGEVAILAREVTTTGEYSFEQATGTLNLGDPLTTEHLDVDNRTLARPINGQIEEIVHGYMRLLSRTALVGNIRNAGRADYDEAIVEDGGGNNRRQTEDPEVVFQEAVGGYVATRVHTFHSVRDQLGVYRARGILTEENVDRMRRQYNEAMARRTYGYENSSDGQLPTIMELPEAMREIIDRDLLGGEIPDSFDDVEQFREFIAR